MVNWATRPFVVATALVHFVRKAYVEHRDNLRRAPQDDARDVLASARLLAPLVRFIPLLGLLAFVRCKALADLLEFPIVECSPRSIPVGELACQDRVAIPAPQFLRERVK